MPTLPRKHGINVGRVTSNSAVQLGLLLRPVKERFVNSNACGRNGAKQQGRTQRLQSVLRCRKLQLCHASVEASGTMAVETTVPISDLRILVQRCIRAEGHSESDAYKITDVRSALYEEYKACFAVLKRLWRCN